MLYLWTSTEIDNIPKDILRDAKLLSGETFCSDQKLSFGLEDSLILYGLNLSEMETIRWQSCPARTVVISDHAVGFKCLEKSVSFIHIQHIGLQNFYRELMDYSQSKTQGLLELKGLKSARFEMSIDSSERRSAKIGEAMDFCKSQKIDHRLFKKLPAVIEEMLTNVIYDAPFESKRVEDLRFRRNEVVQLAESEAASFLIRITSDLIVLQTRDPWGSFDAQRFFTHIAKTSSSVPEINQDQDNCSGAGLGLYRMLYDSHGIFCQVRPELSTDVYLVISRHRARKSFASECRSFVYLK